MTPTGHLPDLGDPNALLGTADLVRLLGLTRRHVRRLPLTKELPPPKRVGRSFVWRAGDVADAIRARLAKGAT